LQHDLYQLAVKLRPYYMYVCRL